MHTNTTQNQASSIFVQRMKALSKRLTEPTAAVSAMDYQKVQLFSSLLLLFIPLGMAKEKKIGKFLTDARVPEEIRKQALIVADTEKIIWLWPIRMSEQAKITTETQRILELKIVATDFTDKH